MKVIIRIASLFWAVVFCFITVHSAHAADISVRLLNETPDGLDMDVTISNYSLIASPYQSYQKIIIQGCGSNAQEGAPGVSLRGQLIELPEGSELAVSYQSLDKITLRNVLLAPAPGAIVEEDKAGSKQLSELYRIDEAAYTQMPFTRVNLPLQTLPVTCVTNISQTLFCIRFSIIRLQERLKFILDISSPAIYRHRKRCREKSANRL